MTVGASEASQEILATNRGLGGYVKSPRLVRLRLTPSLGRHLPARLAPLLT
jgi:hypothetical protein